MLKEATQDQSFFFFTEDRMLVKTFLADLATSPSLHTFTVVQSYCET